MKRRNIILIILFVLCVIFSIFLCIYGYNKEGYFYKQLVICIYLTSYPSAIFYTLYFIKNKIQSPIILWITWEIIMLVFLLGGPVLSILYIRKELYNYFDSKVE